MVCDEFDFCDHISNEKHHSPILDQGVHLLHVCSGYFLKQIDKIGRNAPIRELALNQSSASLPCGLNIKSKSHKIKSIFDPQEKSIRKQGR
jgi:hypothetical protein